MAERAHVLSVGLLLYAGVTQLDLTAPFEVFARMPDTRVYVIAQRANQAVVCEHGLRLVADTAMQDCPPLDVVCVPGGPGCMDVIEDASTLSFLQAHARSARFVTSVCTGALILAAAGLLDGYRATTHWMAIPLLRMFPGVCADPGQRVVVDRDRITAGGVTSGLDFALQIAALLRGDAVAKQIQLTIEYNNDGYGRAGGGTPSTADEHTVERVLAARRALQLERQARLQVVIAAQASHKTDQQ